MGWRRLVDPIVEPLTLAEARAHIQIAETWQDPRITDAIRGARDQVERYCQRALLTQTWELRIGVPAAVSGTPGLAGGRGVPGYTESHRDDFTHNRITYRSGAPWPLVATWPSEPGCAVRLPYAAPLQTVSGVWMDGIPLAASDYAIDATTEPATLWLAVTGSDLRVEYVCGAADPAGVPPSIKEAVYVLMATSFAWREAGGSGQDPTLTLMANELPLSVQLRLDPFALAVLA